MKYKMLLAVIMGNILEFYDFMIFAHLSTVIGPLFFPSDSPDKSHLAILGVFALSNISRLVGAIYFGSMADKEGRKEAVAKTVLLMSLPTLLIGLMPTYATIGVLATIIMIGLRFMQGVAMGGEYNNSGLLLMENFPKNKGIVSGILSSSCQVGSLIALGLVYIVLMFREIEWLWRATFIFGSVFGLISYRLRRVIMESDEFKLFEANKKVKRSADTEGFKEIFKDYRNFIALIAVGGLVGALVWIPITFTNFYVTKTLKLPNEIGLDATLTAIITYIISCVVMGYIADKFKPIKVMLIACMGLIVFAYPLFGFLVKQNFTAFQILITLFTGAFVGPVHAFTVNLYSVNKRGRAVSLGFGLGVGIIGSTTPIVAPYLIEVTGSHYAPAMYLMVLSALAFLSMVKSKQFSDLQEEEEEEEELSLSASK
ncbi:MAG: MFS transporter [Sphingobacteriia bacterium]|nr:MFS transporter [Sphingobacteriia bacterium]